MIYREAKKRVNLMVKQYQIETGTNVSLNKSRYYILVGGLMFTDDVTRIEKEVVADLELIQSTDAPEG